MHPCMKNKAIALACSAALWPGVHAVQAQWGEVFIASRDGFVSGFNLNVDTMVLPDGTPVVGYAQDEKFATLGFVENGVPRYVASTVPGEYTRFESDPFGIINYGARAPSAPVYGTDNGSQTQTDELPLNFLSNLINDRAPADIALTPQGLPSVVGRARFDDNSYFIAEFSVPQASWTTRTVPSGLAVGAFEEANIVASYTDDNRLLLATVTMLNFEIAVEQTNGSYYTISRQTFSNDLGASIASMSDQVAFAFQGDNTTTVGIIDDSGVAFEPFASEGPIAPGALAYDPNGTLSFTYIDQATNEIILAQRTSPGTWDTESLNISTTDASRLSLAFAPDGTPYIGVGYEVGVSLFSPAFDTFVLGDMNGNGALTNGDIAPFVQALTDPDGYAKAYPDLDPNVIGDFSGNGQFTNGDIAGFVAALTGGSASSVDLSALTAVPEPGSLALLTLGGLLLLRRRR